MQLCVPGIPPTPPDCLGTRLVMSYVLEMIWVYSSLQAFGVFGLCQIHAFIDYLRSKLSQSHFDLLFKTLAITVGVAAIVVGGTLTFLGSILT